MVVDKSSADSLSWASRPYLLSVPRARAVSTVLLRPTDPATSGVTSYEALGHVPPPLELVQVVIFTLHVCSVAFRCSQKRS